VSVRIRLTRTGRKNLPSYRIGVFDSHTRRDGPSLEIIGWFNPLCREAGKGFKLEADRLETWVRRGARLTMAVEELLYRHGVTVPGPAAAAGAAAPAPKTAPAARKPAAKKQAPKLDAAAKDRRKRRLEKRASRRASAAKRAAGKAAPAAAGVPAAAAPAAGAS
jgi:small subunit ribosomal protein S16